jgi:hypothetical protein
VLAQPAHDEAGQAAAREVQQQDEEDRKGDRLELRRALRQHRQHVLQAVLQQQHEGRADQRAGELAEAAGDRHQQVLDARAHVERRRADEAVLVRVEPAGDAGEQRGDHEQRQPHAVRIGADAAEQDRAAAQAADRATGARLQQVVREPASQADHRPDQVVDRARVGERPRPRRSAGMFDSRCGGRARRRCRTASRSTGPRRSC